MNLSEEEVRALLGRATVWDLLQLLAFKAARDIAAGGPTLSGVCEANAPGGPVVAVRVAITKKRAPKKKAVRR